MRSIFVLDIALASILDAYGIPKRMPDPVTREWRDRDGVRTESGKWWFDISDDDDASAAREIMSDYAAARDWEGWGIDANGDEFAPPGVDPESPLYWMKGVLENRNANLHLYHHGATPMRVIEHGDRTVYIGPRLSQKDRETLKGML